MRYRATLMLILLVLLPVLLLGWLGYRLQQNEQQLVGLQLQKLVEQQLESVDLQLQTHFQQLETLLQSQARSLYREDPAYSDASVRSLVNRSVQVQQMFVLDANDRRLFPPANQPLSRDEQQLVERLEPLWQSPGLLRPTDTDPVMSSAAPLVESASESRVQTSRSDDYFVSGQLAQRAPSALAVPLNDGVSAEGVSDYAAEPEQQVLAGPSASRVVASKAEAKRADTVMAAEQNTLSDSRQDPAASGWIAWYVDARLLHIYWWRDPQGRTLGFVLNDARLLSDLINRLPDAGAGAAALGEAQIRMLNSQGVTLYSWGQYQQSSPPLRSLGLSHPLGSWSLEYRAPALQAAAPTLLTLIVPLLLLGAGLMGLGYLFYREHRREMELAAQRVNFVNQVSHELKTPLTNVRLYAEMLEQRLEGDEDSAVGRYLGVISDESQRLSRLIENVLSLSRLQRDQLTLAITCQKPDEQLERVVDTFAPLLQQRGIQPRFEPGIGRSVNYDPAVLEQVLNNLLSNCEKYAPDSGELSIRSWLDAQNLCVSVQDLGPGISADEQARIFEPFYRCSNRLTDGITGTGIGLGLARDLARAHGGELCLIPTDKGACFELRLETRE